MNRSYYEGFVDDPVAPQGKPAAAAAAAAAGPLIPVTPRPYDGPYPPPEARPTRPHDVPRPRSVPPPYDAPRRRRRRSPSSSSSSSSACLPERARGLIKDTFTDSRSGLGVGILGALVGGIVAHGVSGASARALPRKSSDGRSEPARDGEKARRFATVAGAVVGGLGANAMEKRFEESRRRERLSRDDWVKKWGEDGGFWESEWGRPPFDQPRGRSRRRGTEEYEVVYEEKRPRRKSRDSYRY